MALTNLEALDVVIGSVNAVSGRTPNPTQTLKQGGILDEPRLGAFKSVVVTDSSRGVQKHGHQIASTALSDVAIDDSVQATADVVRANATPAGAGVLLSAQGSATAPPAAAAKRAPATRAKKTKPAKQKAAKPQRNAANKKKKAPRKRAPKTQARGSR